MEQQPHDTAAGLPEQMPGEIALSLAILRYVMGQLERMEHDLSMENAVHLPDYTLRSVNPEACFRTLPLAHPDVPTLLCTN